MGHHAHSCSCLYVHTSQEKMRCLCYMLIARLWPKFLKNACGHGGNIPPKMGSFGYFILLFFLVLCPYLPETVGTIFGVFLA